MAHALVVVLLGLLGGCCLPFGDSNNCGETRVGSSYDCDVQSCRDAGHALSLFCVDAGTAAAEQARVQAGIDELVATCRATCPSTQSCRVTNCVRRGSCPIPNN